MDPSLIRHLPERCWRLPLFLLLLGLILAGPGCREDTASTGNPPLPTNAIAVVGGVIIDGGDVAAEIKRRPLNDFSGTDALAAKQDLLDEMIRREVLWQQAQAAGYGTNVELISTFKRMVVHTFLEDHWKTQPDLSISDEEIESSYQAHADQYSLPEQRRGAVILMRVPEKAVEEHKAALHRKAETIRVEAIRQQEASAAPASFGSLAQQHSEDRPTRYRGGEMGWVRKGASGRWETPVLEHLFDLEHPGDIAPLIHTATGIYLVKLLEIQPASIRPLEDVKEAIRYQLVRDKEQAMHESFYANLKEKTDIRMNQSLLQSMPLPAASSREGPPRAPGT